MNLCAFNSGRKGEVCLNGCGRTLRMDYPVAPAAKCHLGTPYFIDRTESGYLFGCRSCNWTTITPTDEQPDHRCGQGDCIHKGEAKGTVKVECCSGTEKLLQAHACALHGRCLPGFVNHAAGLKKWEARKPESDLYKLCCICPNRQDVNTHTVSETLVQ
jgi:hypothetical protein